MSYVFTFKINNHIRFQSPLTTERCICISNNGNRCTKNTVIGAPYCWIHLLYQKHLRIKDSNIHNAGKGLFVIDKRRANNAIIFREGQTIIRYHGEIINENELIRRYGQFTAPYGIRIRENQNRYEDGAIERGVGSLINHSANERIINCRFGVSTNNKNPELNDLIIVKAIKNIRNGQELYVNYGDEYNFNEDEVSYDTKYRRL